MMAVFSSSDTVEESVVLSAVSSAVSVRKNSVPSTAPWSSALPLMCRSLFQKSTASRIKASRNRQASRSKVPSVPSTILLNTKDVARAEMTAASSSSARFSVMRSPPRRLVGESITPFFPVVKGGNSDNKYRCRAILA